MWSTGSVVVKPWRLLASATSSVGSSSSFSAAAQPKCLRNSSDDVEWNNAKPFKSVPGPSLLEVIRWFMPGGALYKQPVNQLMFHMEKTYGTVSRLPSLFGRPPMVFTFDPVISEQIYRDEGAWPVRRGLDTFEYYRKKVRPDLFKDISGLVSDNGEAWYKLRSKVNPVMLPTRTVMSYVKPVDEVARDFVHKIGLMRDGNNEMPSDFGTELGAWAFESIGVIALDRRLGAMAVQREPEIDQMITTMKRLLELTFDLDIKPSIWRYVSTKNFRELMASYELLTNLVMKQVDKSVADYDQSNVGAKHEGEESVLQKLLKIDRHYAVVMTLDMLSAGIDTTSNSIINLLYLLAKNPDKQEKLRAEIVKLLPNVESEITKQTLDNAPYFRGALKESMRMQPINSGNIRGTGKDMVLHGFQIPKDTDLFMGNVVTQNNDKYFANSKEFEPERFIRDENGNYPPKTPDHSSFVFLPFGFGSRMCIGKRFAELEMQLLIFRMLRQYRVEWHHGPMEYNTSIFTSANSPLRFRMVQLDK